MALKTTLAALVALGLSGAALSTEGPAPSLQLGGPTAFDAATPKHSLFLADGAPALPASMQSALGSQVFGSLAYEASSFAKDVQAMAEGQDGDRGGYVLLEVVSFILGVIPGFGIGHLVAGSIFGFVTWLCVDIVIAIVLFWIFPILIVPASFQATMYAISVIAVVVERIFEGYGAFRAAYWNYGGGRMSDSGLPRDDRMVVQMAPNLASLHF